MSYSEILYEVKSGTAWITMNKPDRLNAFSMEMIDEIHAALKAAQDDEAVRCIAITGAGRGFCAGANLGGGDDGPKPGEAGYDAGAALEKHYNPMILALRDLKKPTVAAVNGPCAGAGMSLALACDIIIAGRSASFLQAFCNIGLVPDAGSTWHLPRQIGRARALGMTMLGGKVPAEQALEWGMIWQIAEDDELIADAEKITGKLAQMPTYGLGLIRQAMRQAEENDLEAQLTVERNYQTEAGQTHDFAEGVDAFLNKRKPEFKGR